MAASSCQPLFLGSLTSTKVSSGMVPHFVPLLSTLSNTLSNCFCLSSIHCFMSAVVLYFSVSLVCGTPTTLRSLWRNRLAGEALPSSLGVLRQASRASSKLEPSSLHFLSKCLQVWTERSANPLAALLYAEVSSCVAEILLQNSRKGPRN